MFHDGGHVVEGFLPRSAIPAWRTIGKYAIVVLFALLLIVPMLFPAANIVEKVVSPIVMRIADLFLLLAGIRA